MSKDADPEKAPPEGGDKAVAPEAEMNLAEAIQYEHSLPFSEAFKLYPAAIAWSAFVSVGVIMLAFDPQLLGNFAAMTQFQKDFGYLYNDDVRCLSPPFAVTARGSMTM